MKNIVVFAGNKCSREKEQYYFNLAYKTGKLLAEAGYVTVNGGGEGLMTETLKGAFENGGETIGIRLIREGRQQCEFAKQIEDFDKLGPRQDRLISLGDAFIALPGGLGTLHEVIQILSLKRSDELRLDIPMILISDYFKDLKELLDAMIKEGFVDVSLKEIFTLVRTPEEAVEILKNDLK